jgi:hypothetical protein
MPVRVEPSPIDTQMYRVTSGQTLRHPANPRRAYEYWVRPCSASSRIRRGVGGLSRQRAIVKAEFGISRTFTDGPDDNFQGLSQISAGDLKSVWRIGVRDHVGNVLPQLLESLRLPSPNDPPKGVAALARHTSLLNRLPHCL